MQNVISVMQSCLLSFLGLFCRHSDEKSLTSRKSCSAVICTLAKSIKLDHKVRVQLRLLTWIAAGARFFILKELLAWLENVLYFDGVPWSAAVLHFWLSPSLKA